MKEEFVPRSHRIGLAHALLRRCRIPLTQVLQVTALCAALGASVCASANPQLLMDAQKLLAAGNPKQAFMLLVAEQGKLAGMPDYDYLLGVAALDSGKIEESIIAFERVLAVSPGNPGALMDLGRAYFVAGSLDLAEATFLQLRQSNPPTAAKDAIERYLKAIAEKRDNRKRALSAWGEVSFGYDTNITGVPKDFTGAVVSSFNIPGVDATGNSIKRKAPYLGAALGADYVQPFSQTWAGTIGAELRGRGYRHEADFNSLSGEVRGGAMWIEGAHNAKFHGSVNRFNQDGQAPGDPKPTNDRRTATVGGDYTFSLASGQQLSAGLSGSRVRFLKNDIEDFNASAVSAGWLRNFMGAGSPLLQVTGYFSRDKAVRKLADGVSDKSKDVGGLRSYFQYSLTDRLALFNSVGFTVRRDKSEFARATEVEIGRDKLGDVTLGVNWRFQPRCMMRAQWFGARNDSNVAIYDYNRNEFSSNIRCDFM